MEAFMKRYGNCTSVRAELLAIHRGIRMTKRCGIAKLLICVDSMFVESLLAIHRGIAKVWLWILYLMFKQMERTMLFRIEPMPLVVLEKV